MMHAGESYTSLQSAQPTAERAPKLSWRKRILFSAITTFLLLVFFEASMHLFYRVTTGDWLWNWWSIPIYEQDPIRIYRLKANLDYWHRTREYTVRYLTDEIGMRTDGRRAAPTIPKPPGTYRILALGPSFTFGWAANYEDAYMSLIARGLEVPDKQVELVNLGTPGQPMCYQLKWLREAGHLYEPDLIVQTVYGQMDQIDVDDVIPPDRPHVKNGHLYPAETMTISMRVRWLRRYSALLFYGWHVYTAISPRDGPKGDGREFYRDDAPEERNNRDGWVERFKNYVQFVRKAATNNPAVVMIGVPTSWVVRPEDIDRFSHHGGKFSPQLIQERSALLASVLNSNQLHFIDTTPALVKRDRETRMYHFYDIHLTVEGNKVVADVALPIIQDIVLRNEAAKR
jgi:hypothetical protein